MKYILPLIALLSLPASAKSLSDTYKTNKDECGIAKSILTKTNALAEQLAGKTSFKLSESEYRRFGKWNMKFNQNLFALSDHFIPKLNNQYGTISRYTLAETRFLLSRSSDSYLRYLKTSDKAELKKLKTSLTDYVELVTNVNNACSSYK